MPELLKVGKGQSPHAESRIAAPGLVFSESNNYDYSQSEFIIEM